VEEGGRGVGGSRTGLGRKEQCGALGPQWNNTSSTWVERGTSKSSSLTHEWVSNSSNCKAFPAPPGEPRSLLGLEELEWAEPIFQR
jgi:hypothetical protein